MFINGNVYRESITKHICDTCIHDDELTSVQLSNGWTHIMQLPPWHWWPDGMSGGYACDRCARTISKDGRTSPPYVSVLLERLEDRHTA